MKKFFSGLLIFTLLFIQAFTAFGQTNSGAQEELETKEIRVNENLKVIQYKDGRVKGLKNAKGLTKAERAQILKLMKFSDKDIEIMQDELEIEIIETGGVKVPSTMTDFKEVYTDLDGNDHIVTDENREEIKQLIKKDLERYKQTNAKNNGDLLVTASGMGYETDGEWTGFGAITYNGKTSNGTEFKYNYYTQYSWDNRPEVANVDTVAHAWQSHTTSLGSFGRHAWKTPEGITHYWDLDVEEENVGSQAEINLYWADGKQYGYLRDDVRIPVRYEGETGSFVSGYAHPYLPDIIKAVLNFLSINWPDEWAMKKTWRNTFTIGN